MQDHLTEEFQMGATYTAGTVALLFGFYASGMASDLIGRRRTMIVAFLPMVAGLSGMTLFPVWPAIPLFYAMAQCGWSFVLIITRAMPADVIAAQQATDAPRKFMLVLLPAFVADGLSPLIAGAMISAGTNADTLMLIGAVMAIIGMISVIVMVHESLDKKIMERARRGPVLTFKGVGPNFWKLVVGMVPFYFCFNMVIGYLGNLCVFEWGVTDVEYAQTWSAFSFTSALLMYSASELVNRNRRAALLFSVIAESTIFVLFALGSGLAMMFALNIAWALPIVMWGGAERSLVAEGAVKEMQGRTLGSFTFIMSSTGLVAPIVGQWVWITTGSLRTLYLVAGIMGLVVSVPLAILLATLRRVGRESEANQNAS